MKVQFIGATHEVTGSCTLLEAAGRRFLIDCGMEQGKDVYENQPIPVAPGEVDWVLATHAHIDHSGNLPLLFKNGFDGPIYATRETCNLCRIMLRDCAHIQESEAEWRNRKSRRSGGPAYEPVYTLDDAEAAIAHLRPVSYHELVQVGEHFAVRFSDVCHLLGSACIEVFMTENGVERKMVFSGDMASQLMSGMAIVIICGLSYATLMTLYIVPILYDVLFKKPPLSVDVGSDDDLDDIPDDAAEFIAAQGAAQPQP